MAFWSRDKANKVRIYVYENNKQSRVPREKYSHLDFQPDEVVEQFIKENFGSKPKTTPTTDHHLNSLIEQFADYELKKGLNPSTVKNRTACLKKHIIPFFLQLTPPSKEPAEWPFRCVKLLEHMQSQSLSYDSIIRSNVALNSFWNWLQDEGLVDRNINLRLRKPRPPVKETVLKYSLTPQQVISFAENHTSPELAFLALTGYFFSLRTQETLALTRADFRAGTLASQLECSKVMRESNLFDRLAVNISKQNSKGLKSKTAKPKAGSKGWVSCFDAKAAKLIVELIKKLDKGLETLIPLSVDYNIKLWRKNGIPNITLKDLRRASIYWLGHHTKLGIIELKSHARHNKTDTTALYLRRAEEKLDVLDDLDLDA